jgi:hypothetical protein
MEDLRVPKRRTALEIQFHGGSVQRVAVFLGDTAPGHAGPERVSDLLNAEGDFLVAYELETDALTCLNRSAVLVARLPSSFDERELEVDTGTAAHDVEILLTDGTKLGGHLSYALPVARSRLSDFLNVAPRFFRLLERGHLSFVNKNHIVSVKEIRS